MTHTWEELARRLGLAGVFLFVVFMGIGPSFTQLGLALTLVAIVVAPGDRRRLLSQPLFWLTVGFGVYLTLRTLAANREFPDTTDFQWGEMTAWLRLWFFWALAWWMARVPERLPQLLGLALLGFLTGIAFTLTAADIATIQTGERADFGTTALGFGLYSSSAVFGLLMLGPRIWGPRQPRYRFALRVTAWVGVIALLTQGLIMTGSRLSWLAFVLVAPPLLFLRLRPWLRGTGRQRTKPVMMGLAGAVVVVGGLVAANLDSLRQRFVVDGATIQVIVQGDLDKVPAGYEHSLGTRVHLYRFGFQKWLERPWLGWGPGISHHMLAQKRQAEKLADRVDLHNSYLEILVSGGLVGALFFFAGAVYLVRGLVAAYRRGDVPRDMYLFLGGALLMLAVWSFADFRMVHTDWRFYWLLLGGVSLAYAMRHGSGANSS